MRAAGIRAAADSLLLVNAGHALSDAPAAENLAPVGPEGSVCLLRPAAALLEQLMADLGGWRYIAAVSGWRAAAEQQQIWDDSMAAHSPDFTRAFVARPGCSEHQTGLAIDLGLRSDSIDFLRPDFPYTGVCQRVREAAPRYGFVQRYPAGKEHITGIAHEPWHFRYVGIPHAALMAERKLTLEEYLALLRFSTSPRRPLRFQAGDFDFRIFWLPEDDPAAPEENFLRSADNDGGAVITTWKSRDS